MQLFPLWMQVDNLMGSLGHHSSFFYS
uniref:Uncharacterized protein n=1 Tax=Arundo donax TaxID=35708 RepID=A0A0A9A7G0_ARUDO